METTIRKPLGICLSGGGAIGIAHIGVLQALLDNGIEPEVVSGSSMGAIVGTLYAAGYYPSEMMTMIQEDRLYLV
ncbi:MAG: patatin-like phospholipase family protein, partial [Bacteroidia bacterium]|nr:patatin-like phospholipase family protein [Bacteroidia bacterium]